jgi:hypothetical protein|nr:MAG TPA: hypothetical protein [Caudoviricetes sp.]DAS57722.1 MAG TPA: hypothetical protein [Caudoviricetes sp.]
MTREEVRQQLKENPLEWEREAHPRYGYEYLKAKIKRGELQLEYRIFYEYERLELKRVSLYLMAMADRWEGGECVLRKVNDFPTLEEVKAAAEAHRLDFISRRLLGIND